MPDFQVDRPPQTQDTSDDNTGGPPDLGKADMPEADRDAAKEEYKGVEFPSDAGPPPGTEVWEDAKLPPVEMPAEDRPLPGLTDEDVPPPTIDGWDDATPPPPPDDPWGDAKLPPVDADAEQKAIRTRTDTDKGA
jgi:hypothetical protein